MSSEKKQKKEKEIAIEFENHARGKFMLFLIVCEGPVKTLC